MKKFTLLLSIFSALYISGNAQSCDTFAVQTINYNALGGNSWQLQNLSINGDVKKTGFCADYTKHTCINILVLDPDSCIPMQNTDMNQDNFSDQVPCVLYCASTPTFDFQMTDSINRHCLQHFIDIIPEGYHVILYSTMSTNVDSFDAALKASFKTIGGYAVDSILHNRPLA